jgi:ubiquitin C-terminal hydrolase
MNVALQCLLHTTELSYVFLGGFCNVRYDKFIKDQYGINLKVFFESFQFLVQDMHEPFVPGEIAKRGTKATKTSKLLSPDYFKHGLGIHYHKFADKEQHDPQECMLQILDGIHEACDRYTAKSPIQQPQCNGSNDIGDAENSLRIHRMWYGHSFVNDIFEAQYRSQITCSVCNTVSVTFDSLQFLTLVFNEVAPSASNALCVCNVVCCSTLCKNQT